MDPFDEVSRGGSAVPQFNRHGTALSQEERKALAKKNGVCVRCGVTTHVVKMLRRTPITNEHVCEGKCIKCRPEKCPREVVQAWEQKFKPQQAAVQQAAAQSAPSGAASRFRNAGLNVGRMKKGLNMMKPSGVADQPKKAGPSSSASLNYQTSTKNIRPGPEFSRNTSGNYDHIQQLRGKKDDPRKQRHASRELSPRRPIELAPSNHSPYNRGSSTSSFFGEDYTSGGSKENAETLVESLRNNKSEPNVLKQKLHCLRNLAEEAGALCDIKNLMEQYHENPKILSLCCGAIWSVTANDDEKKVIAAEAGCINTIIDVLRDPAWQDNPDLLQWMIGSLSCLCRGAGNRQKIADAGVIETVLNCTKQHLQSAGVFEWSCRMLHALVYQHADEPSIEDNEIQKNIVTIEESHGISIIISAMKQHLNEPIPQMWAVKLLWRLQEHNDSVISSDALKSMNKSDGINVCIKLLRARSTTPVLFGATADLIFNMFSVTGNDKSTHNDASDCITIMTRKMKEHPKDSTIQEACCNLLSIVVPKNRLHFKESDGLKEVVVVFTSFPDNPTLCTAAAKVLWVTSARPVFFDEAYLEDAFCAVESAVGNASSDPELLISSCGFIANAVTFGTAAKDAVPSKIPVNALRLKVEDPILFHQAGRVICALCIKQKKLVPKIIDKDFIQSLVDRFDSSSAEFLCAIYDVLIALGNLSDDFKQQILSFSCLELAKSHIQSSQPKKLIEKALELISVLASQKARTFPLPEDIFQVVMDVHSSFPDLLEHVSVVLRNLLISSIPASKQLNFESLVTFVTDIIDDQKNSLALRREACAILWAFTGRQKNQSQQNLKIMYKSLLSMMSLYNGEQQTYDSDLQAVASGALSRVTEIMGEIGLQMDLKSVAELMHLLYKILENDIDRLELLENILDAVLHLSKVDEEFIIQTGGIVVVIDIMVEHEQSESIQERGCRILAVLSSTKNIQVNCCITETDGIDMLVSSLANFSGNNSIQESACKALSNLSVDSEARMLITSQGGLMLIINAMNSNKDNMDMLEACCYALQLLISDVDEQMLSDPSIYETILCLMNEYPDAVSFQEKAIAVIQCFSMKNKEFKDRIGKAGGIPAVVRAMKEHLGDEALQTRGLATLWSLAVLQANQIEIASVGGIGPIVNAMMLHLMSASLQKQACGCLCSLSNHPDNKRLIREAGAMESLIFTMWAHYNSESVQAEACKVISHLAVNVAMNEVMLASLDEITCLVAAMRRYPKSERCQEYAVMALRNYLLSEDNIENVRNNADQLEQLLMSAASRFPEKCSERANQVLNTLMAN